MNIWFGFLRIYIGRFLAIFLIKKEWRRKVRYTFSLWGDYKSRRHRENRFSQDEKRQQRLIMTLLVKNEETLLPAHLDFHLAQGVDHIIVTDHGSTDSTPEILSGYKKRGVVEVITETSKAYDQKFFVNRMVKLAIDKYKADWIINSDADEFYYAKSENLKDAFPVDGKPNILFCDWIMALPRAGQQWKDVNHFYLFDRGKAMHTAKGFRSVSGGNHKVYLDYVYKPAMSEDIILYHLQSRDFESFKGKLESKYEHCKYTKDKSFPNHLREAYQHICLQDDKEAHRYYDNMREKQFEEKESAGVVVEDNRFTEFLHKAIEKSNANSNTDDQI